jgi:hypothetical protein
MATIPRGHGRRPGFTPIELLIVMGLGVICFGLLVGCVQRAIRDDSRIQCINNLKQIGLGVHNFESTFKRMPPLYGGSHDESVVNSLKFPNVWGSTHVFLLPYVEFDNLFKSMASGTPAVYDPTAFVRPANRKSIPTYACPSDPSMSDYIVADGPYGGTSYAANAQVFSPLIDETIAGGAMYPSSKPNFTDRGSLLRDIKDGMSNVIMFTHSIAACGTGTGTIWGYGAGVNQPPSPIDTYQPWSRASYLSQTFMTPANGAPFQVRPTKCNVSDPATPHSMMMVCLGDASVRSVIAGISSDTWNKTCLPNDGNKLPEDW